MDSLANGRNWMVTNLSCMIRRECDALHSVTRIASANINMRHDLDHLPCKQELTNINKLGNTMLGCVRCRTWATDIIMRLPKGMVLPMRFIYEIIRTLLGLIVNPTNDFPFLTVSGARRF